jgi:hypothetical protein
MNEEIRELAEQAGYRPLPGYDFYNSLEEIFIEKLAKLIAKECAEIALREDHEPYECILKHFGVEE